MTMHNAIIAGASGLVGDELIHLLLKREDIQHVYALGRRELPLHSSKLHQCIDPDLHLNLDRNDGDSTLPVPDFGFICLGTTKKQAGSRQALEAVDYHLVKHVAQQMKAHGVKHIVVISSLFASRRSPSHYLRCKGKMEHALIGMGFEHCIFVRPGPLRGERGSPRKDELLVQSIFDALHPLAVGPLCNFDPIPAEQVAKRMIELALAATRRELPAVLTLSGRMLLDKPAVTL